MAGLTASGLTTGLDVNSLVSQLMTVEQQPLIALNRKEASYQAKISALGSLKSALSALQTAAEALIPGAGVTAADKYTTTSASLSDTTLASASATNTAAAGSYTLTDIVAAKAQQIRKSGLAVPAEAGTLSITVGNGATVSVNIAAGATLAQVRDAVNASGAQATASIINDGTNDVLIFTAKNTGATNTITINGASTDGGTEFDVFDYTAPGGNNSWVEQQPAGSASLKINGITVTSATNSITTAISGVTLNLVKDGVGPTTLTVGKNNAAVTTGLNAFIKAYNDAVGVMKSLGNYDAVNKQASTLTGDATLRSAQSQLRGVLFTKSGGSNASLQLLSDVGVSVQQDGTLKLDSTKLSAAITSDFSSVASLVSNVGTRFKTTISGLIATDGAVTARIDGINSTIKSIGTRRDSLNRLLAKVEENYKRQFTALDVQLSNMQSLSNRLQQQLASLPSASRS